MGLNETQHLGRGFITAPNDSEGRRMIYLKPEPSRWVFKVSECIPCKKPGWQSLSGVVSLLIPANDYWVRQRFHSRADGFTCMDVPGSPQGSSSKRSSRAPAQTPTKALRREGCSYTRGERAAVPFPSEAQKCLCQRGWHNIPHIPARADRMTGINAGQAMAMARSQEPLTP